MAKNLRASGAVVIEDDHVLVVHRPRHDDWSLPKGKIDSDEIDAVTAVREVLEETGYQIRLSLPLPTTRYQVNGRNKVVTWWLGHLTSNIQASEHDPETDQICWLSIKDAIQRLSYETDVKVLTEALRVESYRPVLILRHAEATKRKHWDGDDLDRPLSKRGKKQADELIKLLGAFGVQTLASSPANRCVSTLQPYLAQTGHELIELAETTERAATKDPKAARKAIEELLRSVVSSHTPPAICIHRPVLPQFEKVLGIEADYTLEPAEAWLVGLDQEFQAKTLQYLPPEI